MSGIIFFRTENLEEITRFYCEKIGAELWLDQGGCVILTHGNLLVGFCERETADTQGVITFFYDTKEDVDRMYSKLEDLAQSEPTKNEQYRIYQFFAKDPEGRTVEFQSFLHPVPSHECGEELLKNRRSIRTFKDKDISEETLWALFETCRFAPTSRNSQSYYFVAIRERKKLELLASLRGESSAPIAEAPMAIAICADPKKSGAYIQDGCIAAYHFLLASRVYGLGTCWIAAMDREEVKEALEVPEEHYVATVTPVGYPTTIPEVPSRRTAKEMVTFID